MIYVVNIMMVLAFMAGWGVLTYSGTTKSAIHEIEAFILFLIGAVLLSGSVVIHRLDAIKKLLGGTSESYVLKKKNEKSSGDQEVVRNISTPCPNCSSLNTDTLRDPNGDVQSIRCYDCIRTFKNS